MDQEESEMKRRERGCAHASEYHSISYRIAAQIEEMCSVKRRPVPSHIQRASPVHMTSCCYTVWWHGGDRDEVYGMTFCTQEQD